jgi:hypothetical protein
MRNDFTFYSWCYTPEKNDPGYTLHADGWTGVTTSHCSEYEYQKVMDFSKKIHKCELVEDCEYEGDAFNLFLGHNTIFWMRMLCFLVKDKQNASRLIDFCNSFPPRENMVIVDHDKEKYIPLITKSIENYSVIHGDQFTIVSF